MRPTRWGWALLGFTLTLGAIWAGANVWTLIQEKNNGDHLTKIERIVVGLNRARKAPDRGGDALQPANAGQQPSPGHAAGHQAPSKHHALTHPKHPDETSDEPGRAPPPTKTGSSAGQATPVVPTVREETASPAPGKEVAAAAPGLIDNPGGAAGAIACAAGEAAKELADVQVCGR